MSGWQHGVDNETWCNLLLSECVQVYDGTRRLTRVSRLRDLSLGGHFLRHVSPDLTTAAIKCPSDEIRVSRLTFRVYNLRDGSVALIFSWKRSYWRDSEASRE